MLSRDAASCYWIGRYVERAEATARMVDVHYHAALESTQPSVSEEAVSAEVNDLGQIQWNSLLAISGTEEEFNARYSSANDRDVLYFFTFDLENPNSILAGWKAARDNARAMRELIASEMWESLNVFFLRLREWNVDRILSGIPHEFFQEVKNASHLFQGILNRTMLMSETRDWLDTGRFLERACQTTRLLDVKYHDLLPASPEDAETTNAGAIDSEHGDPLDTANDVGDAPESFASSAFKASDDVGASSDGSLAAPLPVSPYGIGGPLDMHGWIAVLKSVSAFEMYRKTHRDGIRPANVVDFLVLCQPFPASVRHCIGRVEGCLKRISGNQREEPRTDPERLIGRLRADLTYSRPDEIITAGLHEFLDSVQRRCDEVGDAITRTYLVY